THRSPMSIHTVNGSTSGGTVLNLTPAAQATWRTLTGGKSTFISGSDVDWVDFDHDGLLDVSFAGGGGLVIFRNQGHDAFGPLDPLLMSVDPQPTPNVTAAAWADLGGDHFPELAVLRADQDPIFYRNDPAAGNQRAMTVRPWGSTLGYTHNAEWCNLDGATDATPELLVSTNGGVAVFDVSNGVPVATPAIVGDVSHDVHCAPLDDDDDLDLITSGNDTVT